MATYNNQDVKFNFKTSDYDSNSDDHKNLIRQVHQGEIEGFILRNVFSNKEVGEFLEKIEKLDSQFFLKTNTGTIAPDPFATISNLDERLENYISKKKRFDVSGFQVFTERLQQVMQHIGSEFFVRPPKMIVDSSIDAVPATIRHFLPEMGGLFVHCGYLFQEQSPVYYDAVEPMNKEGQLSFFIVLQQPTSGGELTLYDMIWENVNAKDFPENNEYVLDKDGNRVYLSDVNHVKYNPEPGDLLIFYGGKIWHRVEPIIGNLPRITFGGFINFSEDDKSCFYWS